MEELTEIVIRSHYYDYEYGLSSVYDTYLVETVTVPIEFIRKCQKIKSLKMEHSYHTYRWDLVDEEILTKYLRKEVERNVDDISKAKTLQLYSKLERGSCERTFMSSAQRRDLCSEMCSRISFSFDVSSY